jgi:tartrate-resistant acid phosphatase type 5
VVFNGDYGAMLLNATPDSLSMQFFTRRQVLIDSYVLQRPLSPQPMLYPLTPNPFQESTTVEFSLPSPASVQLRVLNNLGQEVAMLQQGTLAAGWHRIMWQRNGLAAGLYYVQLVGSNFSQVARAVAL